MTDKNTGKDVRGLTDLFQKITDQLADGPANARDLYDLIETFAKKEGFAETLEALPYAWAKHDGQFRLGEGRIPYICHPMIIACCAIALGIREDRILATALLHDVCEDCGVASEELPASPEVQDAVFRMSRDYDLSNGRTPEGEKAYYRDIAGSRLSVMVKLLDRLSNVCSMTGGFPAWKIDGYILDTETFVYPLFDRALEECPEYAAQIFMIRYHMWSVIQTVRHMKQQEKASSPKPEDRTSVV